MSSSRASAEVMQFPGHHWFRCGPQCNGCQFCHGGLALCTRCGGYEGSLTSDCCGERLEMETHDAVYDGCWDYRKGEWVQAASPHCPGAHNWRRK